jgi:ArsR family transcriptional regulator, virulence genes transcriptional regulator
MALAENGVMHSNGELAADADRATRAANMLRALANPHRLMILRLLDRAPHNVMDLCERLGLRQSLASQHLARLRLDGIVTAERQGHHVIYSMRDGKAREILSVLADDSLPERGKVADEKRTDVGLNGRKSVSHFVP